MKKVSFFVLALGLLISCKNDGKNQPEVKTVESEMGIHEPVPANAKFKDMAVAQAYDEYIKLKSALVNSDAEKSQIIAKQLANTIEKIEPQSDVREAVVKIASVPDIETQREAFQYLTEGMVHLVKGNFSQGNIYVQYCPMAFNNQGAYWLSNSKEIRNPYFGDKMLKCGEVKDVLQ